MLMNNTKEHIGDKYVRGSYLFINPFTYTSGPFYIDAFMAYMVATIAYIV